MKRAQVAKTQEPNVSKVKREKKAVFLPGSTGGDGTSVEVQTILGTGNREGKYAGGSAVRKTRKGTFLKRGAIIQKIGRPTNQAGRSRPKIGGTPQERC